MNEKEQISLEKSTNSQTPLHLQDSLVHEKSNAKEVTKNIVFRMTICSSETVFLDLHGRTAAGLVGGN